MLKQRGGALCVAAGAAVSELVDLVLGCDAPTDVLRSFVVTAGS